MAQDKKYEITVAAESKYLSDQSDEPAGRYVFAYTIRCATPAPSARS
jgi:uncharacterized protein affecting Mg2+/Co2+ transport